MVKRMVSVVLVFLMACGSLALGSLEILVCMAVIRHWASHIDLIGLLGPAVWALLGFYYAAMFIKFGVEILQGKR